MSSYQSITSGWRPLNDIPIGCVWLFGRKVKVPCTRGLAYG